MFNKFAQDRRDENPAGIRQRAGLALGSTGDPRAVELLIAALKGANAGVPEQAAIARGVMEDSRAMNPLLDALKDEDERARRSAGLALHSITGEDLGPGPAKWAERWEQHKDAFAPKSVRY